MEAPKCRFCEKRHYGACAVAKSVSPPARSLVDEISASAVAEASGLPVSEVAEKLSENDSPLTQSERNARYRARNREKYNAYMRDYRRRTKDG